MGRKLVRIILALGVLVAGTFALRVPSVPSASATSHASEPRLSSARGLSLSIGLEDYTTHDPLACGGTYVIDSWIQGTIRGSARTAGTTRLAYLTNENGHKYWQARSTVHLSRGSQVIGGIKQWPDRHGDTDRFTFTVRLFRESSHTPQASIRCTVRVSRTPH
jgi:hypothetical protein